MWGKPKDVEGQCNAHLYLGDDHGDGVCTMRCGLSSGHTGRHEEVFERDGGHVIVTWAKDERCYHEWKACEHDWEFKDDGWQRCRKCWTTAAGGKDRLVEQCIHCHTERYMD